MCDIIRTFVNNDIIMTTLKEIADEAGVSVSTVSLVINNKPSVTEEKRKKVLEIIESLHYIPDPTARALRKKSSLKTESFGVLIPADLSSFSTSSHIYRTIAGIEKEIKNIGYHLILGSLEIEGNAIRLPRMLEQKNIDGVIIISVAHVPMARVIETVLRYKIPAILIGYPGEAFEIPSVMADNQRASYEATCHLISGGFSRIATITGPLSYPAARERLEGYKLALLENSFPINEGLIYQGDFTESSGRKGIEEILGRTEAPFGLLAAGDFMAKGALNSLMEKGINVPEQVGIIGFDDVEHIVSSTNPRLSSVRIPWEGMGASAVRQLMSMNDNSNLSLKTVLPCRLVIRESSIISKGGA